jgi:hypothetical protein
MLAWVTPHASQVLGIDRQAPLVRVIDGDRLAITDRSTERRTDLPSIRRSLWDCGADTTPSSRRRAAEAVDRRTRHRPDQPEPWLACDFERHCRIVAAFVHVAMIRIMLPQLAAKPPA